MKHTKSVLALLTFSISMQAFGSTIIPTIVCGKGEDPDKNGPTITLQVTPENDLGDYKVTYQITEEDKEGYVVTNKSEEVLANRCGYETRGRGDRRVLTSATCGVTDAAGYIGEQTLDDVTIERERDGSYYVEIKRLDAKYKKDGGPFDFDVEEWIVEGRHFGSGFDCRLIY
ncbi:MAG: hypothetical protein V4692_03385 [Bdellovibrionota bacterium]